MAGYILAYDLGTGGCKASLYRESGECLCSTFVAYDTHYPKVGWHEQKPQEWWRGFCESTKKLLASTRIAGSELVSLALSGHSLGVVPIDRRGRLLRETVPIWSDTRAKRQADEFFSKIDPEEWYRTTGSGFSKECYAVFKIMWYRDDEPELFAEMDKVIGTKDFINYKLTGNLLTDNSYASGSGIYNLRGRRYDRGLLEASGLPREIFPEIVPATHVVGAILPEVAEDLGLPKGLKVICGGVDNSCMALGAGNIAEGKVYLSLGSSAWIAVSSKRPLIDARIKPFVFDHVVPDMYTSATSIFAAGSALKWLKDTVCANLAAEAEHQGKDSYSCLISKAQESPLGANKLLFNPSLAGGSAANVSPNIKGAFLGLDLAHKQEDLIRAVLEGIAMDLSLMYQKLKKISALEEGILVVGGGSKSRFWRQILADVFHTGIFKANVDQEAGSLGAAAIAAVGVGLWPDFSKVLEVIRISDVQEPDPERSEKYRRLTELYFSTLEHLASLGNSLSQLEI